VAWVRTRRRRELELIGRGARRASFGRRRTWLMGGGSSWTWTDVGGLVRSVSSSHLQMRRQRCGRARAGCGMEEHELHPDRRGRARAPARWWWRRQGGRAPATGGIRANARGQPLYRWSRGAQHTHRNWCRRGGIWVPPRVGARVGGLLE
jgi:hypothetical protein